ncbi:outer membrane protein transport protein [soil metagenome]
MKFKIVFAIMGLVLLGANELFAQSYVEEALIISRTRGGGSARIQGMGGVQNALGGDVSSAYYNPAGLGMYNRSDFSITPGYTMVDNSSTYLNNTTSATKNSLIVPNFGIAFHTNKDGSKGLWGGTFAINFNRINDFNTTFTYTGTNKDNSVIDYFLNNAKGSDTLQFENNAFNYNTPTGLAYYNYIIGPKSILGPGQSNTDYFTDVALPGTAIPGKPGEVTTAIQTETVKTSGAQNQWSFSYGANFNDKIFIGGGIGFTTLRYKSEKTYSETFPDASVQPLTSLTLNEALSISGSGINATIGAIYRPLDIFQVGLSVASPTAYQISDTYVASMTSIWKNFEYYPGKFLNNVDWKTNNVSLDYNLNTPWRISGGGTVFIAKKGLISADREWLNDSSSKYSTTTGGVSFSEDNNTIKGLYTSVLNIRVGGEYRWNNYRFRAGYNRMADPYKSLQNDIDQTYTTYSAGLGYRISTFYIDLAGIFGQGTTPYSPYPGASVVSVQKNSSSFLVTIGFPF